VLLKWVKGGGVYAERCSISSLPYARQVEPHSHITYGVWGLHIAATHLACKVGLGVDGFTAFNTTALGTKISLGDLRVSRPYLWRLSFSLVEIHRFGEKYYFHLQGSWTSLLFWWRQCVSAKQRCFHQTIQYHIPQGLKFHNLRKFRPFPSFVVYFFFLSSLCLCVLFLHADE
jgi:hypothetical protein